jgi:transcriptional regulator with XRE-family HTH domain
MSMTPQQCRAARTLLHWSREELADNSDLSVEIVEDFELARRPIDSGVIDALQVALEYAGIEFLARDNPDGALVRFRE